MSILNDSIKIDFEYSDILLDFPDGISSIKELPKEEITVALLEQVAFNCYAFKNLASNLDKKKKEATANKEEMQELMGHLMDLLEVTSYKSKSGTITKSEQPNYRLPQDDDSRKKFFSYLKEKGLYDQLITVNSRSLQSFVKQEVELAEAEDNFGFLPDGIEETEYRTVYSLRK